MVKLNWLKQNARHPKQSYYSETSFGELIMAGGGSGSRTFGRGTGGSGGSSGDDASKKPPQDGDHGKGGTSGDGGGGGGGASGGGGPQDACGSINLTLVLQSPQQSEVAKLKDGDLLEVQLTNGKAPIIAVNKSGKTVGVVLPPPPDLKRLMDCLMKHKFVAEVLKVSGGAVKVRVYKA